MHKIPTPFVGGTGGPEGDRAANENLQPPFHTGEEGSEMQEPAVEPDSEPTPSPVEEAPAPVEETAPELEPAPWDTLEPEPVSVDVTEAEPELAGLGEVSPVIEAASPLEDIAAELEAEATVEDMAAEIEAEATIAAPPEVVEPQIAPTIGAETDLPDFLMGPDTQTPEPAKAATQPPGIEAPPVESVERLAEVAHELLEGGQGEWIRTLIADLSPLASEIAVPRAFAAGYLAARTQKEK